METNKTIAKNSFIDWESIKENYPRAVALISEEVGTLTDNGWVDVEIGLMIPECCLMELEDHGADVSNEAYLKTEKEFADFYNNAFKEVEDKINKL